MSRKMTSHQGRHPLSESVNSSLSSTSSSGGMRVGKVAGVTIVECAAVCCCPCGMVSLLVLTFYKLPASLCRKAIRRWRCRQRLNGRNPHELGLPVTEPDDVTVVIEVDGDVAELEKEKWDWFNETGFWRSASQRMKLNNTIITH